MPQMVNPPVTTPNLTTFTVKDLVSAAEIFFQNALQNNELNARKLFIIDNIGNNEGTEKIFEEYDMEDVARSKPEGVAVSKLQAGTGYYKIARMKRYGAERDISEESIKFNKYPKVRQDLTNLSGSVQRRMEHDLTQRITNCLAATLVNMDGQVVDITTGDCLSLCNAAHLCAFSPVTYSNRVSGDPVVSAAAIEEAEKNVATQIVNSYGLPKTLDFNIIFTGKHPTAVNAVRTVLQSTAAISAPNAGVTNVYKAKYEHVILPTLDQTATMLYDSTKKNFWGLVAGQKWQAHLAIWEEENLRTPTPTNNLCDGHTDVLSFGVRGAYDIAILNGLGIVISPNAT
jgi:hypothetical protein